jgi:hypothetical protein
MGKRLNTESFIEISNELHNKKYDYSLVDYKNNKTKVHIICTEHGVFEQMPINHIHGKSGCPFCYGNVKFDNSKFIERSNVVHKKFYDYSLVEYHNNKTKVKIKCPLHGVFEQTPNSHLDGHGCKKCFDIDTNKFLNMVRSVHGDVYDYDRVKYINMNTPVEVICRTHGVFNIKPSYFLNNKKGCIWCSKRMYKDLSFFVKDAQIIHGDKYEYSVIDDLKQNSFIKISCPLHGDFLQKIHSHMSGCGCPNCNESKGERRISIFLDENNIEYIRQHKFDECKNVFRLSFDFYLPKINICIEYDGEHHFHPVDFFGGNDRFMKVKKNDEIKNSYCEQNGIRLIRVRYDDDISSLFDAIKKSTH